MSDTTPRPDETPGDPTAPTAESAWTPPPPPPASQQPQAPYQQPQAPYQQPQALYQQPQDSYQQTASPGLCRGEPGHGRGRGPNPMSPTQERTTGIGSPTGWRSVGTVLSGGFLGFVAALVMYLVFRDRGPFVLSPLGERAQRADHRRRV